MVLGMTTVYSIGTAVGLAALLVLLWRQLKDRE